MTCRNHFLRSILNIFICIVERISDQFKAVFISFKLLCFHLVQQITKIQFCDTLKNDQFCLVFVGSDRLDRSGSKFNLRQTFDQRYRGCLIPLLTFDSNMTETLCFKFAQIRLGDQKILAFRFYAIETATRLKNDKKWDVSVM